MNVSISTIGLIGAAVAVASLGYLIGYLVGRMKGFSKGMDAGLEAGKEIASHGGNGMRSVGYATKIIPTPPTREGPQGHTRIGS
jgi:hypothetical protein